MHRDDQAAGLRRLFSTPPVTLAVAAREAALIEAYGLMKRVVQEEGSGCFRITITHARSEEEALAVFENLRRVAHEYLGVRLEYLGLMPGLDRQPLAVAAGGGSLPPRMLRNSVL